MPSASFVAAVPLPVQRVPSDARDFQADDRRRLEAARTLFRNGPAIHHLADKLTQYDRDSWHRTRGGTRKRGSDDRADGCQRSGRPNKDLIRCELREVFEDALSRAQCEDSAWLLLRPEHHGGSRVEALADWAHVRCITERANYGYDVMQQNQSYSIANHISMVRDRSRVGAYAEAIRRASPGATMCDVGTGPFTLLSRLALGAGAHHVTAIEQADSAVASAVAFFRDELSERRQGHRLLADREGLEDTPGEAWGTRGLSGAPAIGITDLLVAPAQLEREGQDRESRQRPSSSRRRRRCPEDPPSGRQLRATVTLSAQKMTMLRDAIGLTDLDRHHPPRGIMPNLYDSWHGGGANGAVVPHGYARHGHQQRGADEGTAQSAACGTERSGPYQCGMGLVSTAAPEGGCRALLKGYSTDAGRTSTLALYQGLSSKVTPELQGEVIQGTRARFTLVVHEILGHIASAEGAAVAIRDLVDRGLCAPGCAFIPRAAATLIAPTEALHVGPLDRVLHRYLNGSGEEVRTQVRHHCRRFPRGNLLAPPQPFEELCFGGLSEPGACRQRRQLEFRAQRAGVVDGVHLHMEIALDDQVRLNMMEEADSSWSTTYIRLSRSGVHVAAGERLLCQCEALFDTTLPRYYVHLSAGEPGRERVVGEFKWEGCG
ncbi:hypothetical protein CYMTET_41793 [Cymbomonas tetramitiformis]|uniref:Uncharacterized protein n=1 Tax=Cymbomonas tetramitiformis TaxID=36881 RepID=A0AAE0F1V6_9CHLO|nr:hypothetical protein CYMTET_41793 [Cymbomonas tetramitiformis]